MSSTKPANLAPPNPTFVVGEAPAEQDNVSPNTRASSRAHIHSRTISGATSSMLESPQSTPRSLTFSIPAVNPFTSFSTQQYYTPDMTPGSTPGPSSHGGSYPFPDVGSSAGAATPRSGVTSVSTSVADLTRAHSAFYNRPMTSDYAGSNRPLSARSREAFQSPRPRPVTIHSVVPSEVKIERARAKSTMLTTPELHKPWVTAKDPWARIAYAITYLAMFVGVGCGFVRAYLGWSDVSLLSGDLCPVMDEDFSSPEGIFGENGKFFREVDMSGFGNGEFEMTTASKNNSYVKDGFLYITPTLTSDIIGEAAIVNGSVFNITGCTYNITQGISYTSQHPLALNESAIGTPADFDLDAYTNACSAVSNATTGEIINPVQSARISTRKTASIKYGRVEVRAKIPTGDWLWPAIWMLPVDNAYGPWPMSGEIDIMEARGNGPTYPKQGNNYVRGSLNWGPLTWLNAVSKTFGWWFLRRGSWDQDFHTYALEWDETFLRLYVDTRLHHMLQIKFTEPFFKRGDFPGVVQNGSEAVILTNPWINGTNAAPFDQSFYLILNVAVGGTNGWFPDGPEKPWLDGSRTAMSDFWRARGKWLPTWSTEDPAKRSMVVDSIKMWQKC